MHWPSWLTFHRRRLLQRAGKVAIAAALATIVAQLLDLQNPWFATLSAIVAMEVTMRASVRAARNSLIGAAIGAGGGILLSVFAKEQAWAVALVVLVAFVGFGLVRMEAAGRQAALVGSVIVLVPERVDMSTTDFAWVRLVETAIGIAVALAVHATLFRPRAYKGVRRELAAAYAALADLYRRSVRAALDEEPKDHEACRELRAGIRKRLAAVDELWDEAMAERPTDDTLATHWRVTTRRIWEQVAVMDSAVPTVRSSEAVRRAATQLDALADSTASALRAVGESFTGSALPARAIDLTVPRLDALEAVRRADERFAPATFEDTVHLLAFVNAMEVVAVRLSDAAEATDPTAAEPVSAT